MLDAVAVSRLGSSVVTFAELAISIVTRIEEISVLNEELSLDLIRCKNHITSLSRAGGRIGRQLNLKADTLPIQGPLIDGVVLLESLFRQSEDGVRELARGLECHERSAPSVLWYLVFMRSTKAWCRNSKFDVRARPQPGLPGHDASLNEWNLDCR